MKNKKAQADSLPFMLIYIIAITVLIFLFIMLIDNNLKNKLVPSKDLEEYLLVSKFLSSGECFSYYDATANSYLPQSIDFSKFNRVSMENCYPAADDNVAVKLTLSYNKESSEIISSNWNNEIYAEKRLKPYFVSLYRGESKINAKLIMEMQNVKK
jgi:hypothetical protein